MTDSPSNEPPSGPDAAPAPAPAPPRRHWWHHWKLILVGALAAPALAFALYTLVALKWTYSEGERAGTLTKFSHKGWLCKTWEGELMQPTAPGVPPTLWAFTVRNDSVAAAVNGGLGKRVVLLYREHRGVPSTCFGETSYFVDGIRVEP